MLRFWDVLKTLKEFLKTFKDFEIEKLQRSWNLRPSKILKLKTFKDLEIEDLQRPWNRRPFKELKIEDLQKSWNRRPSKTLKSKTFKFLSLFYSATLKKKFDEGSFGKTSSSDSTWFKLTFLHFADAPRTSRERAEKMEGGNIWKETKRKNTKKKLNQRRQNGRKWYLSNPKRNL